MDQVRAIQNVLVVNWCVLFGLERVNLEFGVVQLEFFLSLYPAASHLDDLVEGERVEMLLQIVTVGSIGFFWVFLDAHHVVKARALGSWLLCHVAAHLTISFHKVG